MTSCVGALVKWYQDFQIHGMNTQLVHVLCSTSKLFTSNYQGYVCWT